MIKNVEREGNILGRYLSTRTKKRRKICCDSVESLDSFSAEPADAAEAVSSRVDRCIHTNYLFVFLFLIFVVTICFMVLVAAATIIHLMDCLYDILMEAIAEESSSAAKATAAAAKAEATGIKESSSAAKATAAAAKAAAAKAAPCQCTLFWHSIYHRR
jgi:hypothetical protein